MPYTACILSLIETAVFGRFRIDLPLTTTRSGNAEIKQETQTGQQRLCGPYGTPPPPPPPPRCQHGTHPRRPERQQQRQPPLDTHYYYMDTCRGAYNQITYVVFTRYTPALLLRLCYR